MRKNQNLSCKNQVAKNVLPTGKPVKKVKTATSINAFLHQGGKNVKEYS